MPPVSETPVAATAGTPWRYSRTATWRHWILAVFLAAHVLFYVLMVLVPLAGYIGSAYSRAGVAFFGLVTPRWTAPDHDTAEQFFSIHSVLAWTLAAIVALHLPGALKHAFLDRDGVFQRMWHPENA